MFYNELMTYHHSNLTLCQIQLYDSAVTFWIASMCPADLSALLGGVAGVVHAGQGVVPRTATQLGTAVTIDDLSGL